MKYSLFLLCSFVSFMGCSTNRLFRETAVKNPQFYPNKLFVYYKNDFFPHFQHLKEKYRLDTIFRDETDEFKRILLLRNWINKTVPITQDGIVHKSEDTTTELILDDALKGHSFHCAYFMIVQCEIMNACGFPARVINVDEGENNLPGQIAHHGTDEVWSNTYHKWFYSDAMFNLHFEKNGIPLSALEIRAEYLKNKAADITMMYGPKRTPVTVTPDKYRRSTAIFARVFRWIAWFKQSDIYSNWDNGISYLIMYEDDYFNTHQWIRADGKPHWAYGTPYLIGVKDSTEIYWTPNTITSDVKINSRHVTVKLRSITPFFRSYQMKNSKNGEWKDVSDSLNIPLKQNNRELFFKTVNLQEQKGAVHTIFIER